MLKILLILFAICDLVSFIMYGADKRRAKKGKWRISEKALLLSALPGGVGAFFGMKLFHHKTKKPAFYILVPLCAVAQIAVCVWAIAVFSGQ